MQFIPTKIQGTFIIEPDLRSDERGAFGRVFCTREFTAQGLPDRFVQCSISFNRKRHTLRGLHFQRPPHAEDKLIRCTAGAVYDVVVDLRVDSPTRLSWIAADLSAENRRALFVPKGCAHGFLTMTDDSELLYAITEFYEPAAADGVRWNDPAIGIVWPVRPAVIVDRDASYPDVVR